MQLIDAYLQLVDANKSKEHVYARDIYMKDIRSIHIYGVSSAPNWNQYEMIKTLAHSDVVGNRHSDQGSTLIDKHYAGPKTIPYFSSVRLYDEKPTMFTCMNDTGHLPIDEITFDGRKVDIQFLMFTWFDFFQYKDVQQGAQNVAKYALESDIPLGLIVDVTAPKRFLLLKHINLESSVRTGYSGTYIDIPELLTPFIPPVPEDIPIFMEMLGLDCPWIMVDCDQPKETIQTTVDDLIRRCT